MLLGSLGLEHVTLCMLITPTLFCMVELLFGLSLLMIAGCKEELVYGY